MTDTSQAPDYDEDGEELELPDLYTETESSLIYEVKLFQNFVFVRPATPELYLAIRKLSYPEFARQFRPFYGDKDAVRQMMWGAAPDFIVEKK
jgi:hypothetical protein